MHICLDRLIQSLQDLAFYHDELKVVYYIRYVAYYIVETNSFDENSQLENDSESAEIDLIAVEDIVCVFVVLLLHNVAHIVLVASEFLAAGVEA